MNNGSSLKNSFLDIIARKPSGWLGRFIYGHLSAMEATDARVIDALQLTPDDVFLEIGQGAGLLVKKALETVQQAAAIDHSADMVALARRNNQKVVDAGRADIRCGGAEALPWPDDHFTCGACIATFLFIDDPGAALQELLRVLAPGGCFVIVTPSSEGEGMLPRLFGRWPEKAYLYDRDQMEALLQQAGFESIDVELSRGRLWCAFTAPD
ncbi:MAG: class I SAM-dependent methyltransferase [Armatimonadota bacterium]